ncbi:hypothetical protein [Terriglobus sp. RCC_193]|uniref:hypothetical protein n=1 Tax=Terriglobus sp. RCC_193 TaxID=3239218 RepID=UPI003525FA22
MATLYPASPQRLKPLSRFGLNGRAEALPLQRSRPLGAMELRWFVLCTNTQVNFANLGHPVSWLLVCWVFLVRCSGLRGMQVLQLRFAAFRMTVFDRTSFAFAKLVLGLWLEGIELVAGGNALGFFAALRMTAFRTV